MVTIYIGENDREIWTLNWLNTLQAARNGIINNEHCCRPTERAAFFERIALKSMLIQRALKLQNIYYGRLRVTPPSLQYSDDRDLLLTLPELSPEIGFLGTALFKHYMCNRFINKLLPLQEGLRLFTYYRSALTTRFTTDYQTVWAVSLKAPKFNWCWICRIFLGRICKEKNILP